MPPKRFTGTRRKSPVKISTPSSDLPDDECGNSPLSVSDKQDSPNIFSKSDGRLSPTFWTIKKFGLMGVGSMHGGSLTVESTQDLGSTVLGGLLNGQKSSTARPNNSNSLNVEGWEEDFPKNSIRIAPNQDFGTRISRTNSPKEVETKGEQALLNDSQFPSQFDLSEPDDFSTKKEIYNSVEESHQQHPQILAHINEKQIQDKTFLPVHRLNESHTRDLKSFSESENSPPQMWKRFHQVQNTTPENSLESNNLKTDPIFVPGIRLDSLFPLENTANGVECNQIYSSQHTEQFHTMDFHLENDTPKNSCFQMEGGNNQTWSESNPTLKIDEPEQLNSSRNDTESFSLDSEELNNLNSGPKSYENESPGAQNSPCTLTDRAGFEPRVSEDYSECGSKVIDDCPRQGEYESGYTSSESAVSEKANTPSRNTGVPFLSDRGASANNFTPVHSGRSRLRVPPSGIGITHTEKEANHAIARVLQAMRSQRGHTVQVNRKDLELLLRKLMRHGNSSYSPSPRSNCSSDFASKNETFFGSQNSKEAMPLNITRNVLNSGAENASSPNFTPDISKSALTVRIDYHSECDLDSRSRKTHSQEPVRRRSFELSQLTPSNGRSIEDIFFERQLTLQKKQGCTRHIRKLSVGDARRISLQPIIGSPSNIESVEGSFDCTAKEGAENSSFPSPNNQQIEEMFW